MSVSFWTDLGTDLDRDPNFANGNACLVLEALGFYGHDLWAGDAEISAFRAACVRALNASELPEREAFDGRAPARVVDGAIVRGPRVISCGLTQAGVRERVKRLLDYVADAQARGASQVIWG